MPSRPGTMPIVRDEKLIGELRAEAAEANSLRDAAESKASERKGFYGCWSRRATKSWPRGIRSKPIITHAVNPILIIDVRREISCLMLMIIDLSGHDAILGTPWMSRYGVILDMSTDTVLFPPTDKVQALLVFWTSSNSHEKNTRTDYRKMNTVLHSTFIDSELSSSPSRVLPRQECLQSETDFLI